MGCMMLLKDMYWDGSQIIDIEYKDTDGNITTRTVRLESVSPNPFSQHNNSLIFYGFCFLRNEYRTFKYSNILSIKVDGNIVNPVEFLSNYCGIKYDTRTLENKQKFPNGVMCITGTFSIPRAEIEAYIESCGFDIQQQIGANTKWLAVGEKLKGDKPTYSVSKIETATKRGIKIIRESELMDLIESKK